MMKRPEARDAKAKALDARLRAFALEHNMTPSRARRWVSYMALGGALTRASHAAEQTFTLKGGVALELRLGNVARATRDVDVIIDGVDDELVRHLERAFTQEYEGFRFTRKGEPYVMQNRVARIDVAIAYYGFPWATIQMDLSSSEGGKTEVEFVDALPIARLALPTPGPIPCLSLRYQIAQKLHALSTPTPDGRPNDRFRDLIDLLLLMPLIQDFRHIREACIDVFTTRATRAWPPRLLVPPEWEHPFIALAHETGLSPVDFTSAAAEVQAFIDSVHGSHD